MKTNASIILLLISLAYGTVQVASALPPEPVGMKENSFTKSSAADGASIMDGSFILFTLAISYGIHKFFRNRKKASTDMHKTEVTFQ